LSDNRKLIAHINHYFPLIRQTFTYREVKKLQEEGLPIQTYSLKNVEGLCQSEEGEGFIRNTVYLPSVFSIDSMKANLIQFLENPKKYLKWVFKCILCAYTINKGWRELIQSFFQFVRASTLADRIKKNGKCLHIHSQFVDGAATTALIASEYLNVSYSFYSHTSSNVQFLEEKLNKALFIFSISEFDKNILLKVLPDAGKKIHVVHCGIPLDEWHFRPVTPKSNSIISVGGLDEFKGHHILIEACRILLEKGRDFDCQIIGEGPFREKLENKISEYNLRGFVSLKGNLPQEEIKPLLKDAGIFTLASVKSENGNMDGIPVALMEAMASGVPVISTNISGIGELIEHGRNGWLAESGNAEELAGLMLQVLDNYESITEIVADARRTIEEGFSLEVQGAKMAQIFRGVLNNNLGE
jgi:glycosyltransferase involved in cell wall biosynthesis